MAKKTTRKSSSKKTSSSRSAKTTRKSAAGKKARAKKPAAKQTAAKKTQKKKATKKTAAKKTASRKTRAKKTSAKKTASKKTTAKKTTAKKPTPKKTTAKKTTTRSARPAGRAATTPSRPRIQAPPRRPERRVRPAKFDAEQLAAIRAQLVKERTELEQQLTEVEEESFTGTQSELSGDAGLNDDFADAGSATFDRENALSIRNNIRDLIDQITRAMGRIDEGTYGTCERCGKPIDAARLKALPHALLCMDCKRREERAR